MLVTARMKYNISSSPQSSESVSKSIKQWVLGIVAFFLTERKINSQDVIFWASNLCFLLKALQKRYFRSLWNTTIILIKILIIIINNVYRVQWYPHKSLIVSCWEVESVERQRRSYKTERLQLIKRAVDKMRARPYFVCKIALKSHKINQRSTRNILQTGRSVAT